MYILSTVHTTIIMLFALSLNVNKEGKTKSAAFGQTKGHIYKDIHHIYPTSRMELGFK